MKKQSAGILAYRFINSTIEFLLVHPGGPYFTNKDTGAWSVPKGEFDTEEALEAAKREFEEEVGISIDGTFIELSPIVQKGGKTVFCWAIECDINVKNFKSNTFNMEWPPRSGKFQDFPEIDRAEWFESPVAKEKINNSQASFIDELISKFGS
jgi:predicted NUDIX family NTP pyrophosphohydrolase